jgi:cyclomaltodextrinase / maltogenic alpha-amylase / neopullulanase
MTTTGAGGPGWVQDAIWWHVYPLGFVGAEARSAADQPVVHRLAHLEGWLDHAVELGASGLALGPVFAAETHGYDTTDHLRVDPRLGDDADLDALIAACRERGLRVLLDGVFNHVGRSHPAFRAVLEQGPAAPTASWFRLRWPGGEQAWTPGTEPDHDDFEGHRHLVALDHDSPEVVDHVVDVMNHWLDRGVDGWRLDAAYAVPTSFWCQVADRVRARHPDAYLMGEVIHGDYAGFVRAAHLDAVTQYELWKAVWSALNDGNFFELDAALTRHGGFLDHFVPYTFLGNHDVTPHRQPADRRAPSGPRARRPLHHRRHPGGLRRGRARLPRRQGGPCRRRRRRPARLPRRAGRPLTARPAHVPPPPGTDRPAPPASLAAHGPDHHAAPGQRAARSRGRR